MVVGLLTGAELTRLTRVKVLIHLTVKKKIIGKTLHKALSLYYPLYCVLPSTILVPATTRDFATTGPSHYNTSVHSSLKPVLGSGY